MRVVVQCLCGCGWVRVHVAGDVWLARKRGNRRLGDGMLGGRLRGQHPA